MTGHIPKLLCCSHCYANDMQTFWLFEPLSSPSEFHKRAGKTFSFFFHFSICQNKLALILSRAEYCVFFYFFFLLVLSFIFRIIIYLTFYFSDLDFASVVLCVAYYSPEKTNKQNKQKTNSKRKIRYIPTDYLIGERSECKRSGLNIFKNPTCTLICEMERHRC